MYTAKCLLTDFGIFLLSRESERNGSTCEINQESHCSKLRKRTREEPQEDVSDGMFELTFTL